MRLHVIVLCISFQESQHSSKVCHTIIKHHIHGWQTRVRLTFRNDISRSMPSLSNLREGRMEREQKKRRSGEVGVMHRCW